MVEPELSLLVGLALKPRVTQLVVDLHNEAEAAGGRSRLQHAVSDLIRPNFPGAAGQESSFLFFFLQLMKSATCGCVTACCVLLIVSNGFL